MGQIKECPTKKLGSRELSGKVTKVPLPPDIFTIGNGGLSLFAMARPTHPPPNPPSLSVVLQEASISNLEIVSGNYKQIFEICLF